MSAYRRQYKRIGSGIVLCLCFFLNFMVSGYAESAEIKALNDAAERIGSADSLTIRMRLVFSQNGVEKLSGDVICQVDKEREYLHATLADEHGKTRDAEIASSDGRQIIRDGDDYYAMPEDWEKGAESFAIPEPMTVDQLRADLKGLIGAASDKLTVTDTGLSLHLTKEELPFFLGLAIGFADGYVIQGDDAEGFSLPLGYGLYIDHIDLDIPVKDGDIGDVRMEIALGGRSKEGTDLLTNLSVDCSFSDINSTTPAIIDTTGVELKTLD